MNNYSITYYTLSDCTNTVTVTADSEAAARALVMQRSDVEMIVGASQVATVSECEQCHGAGCGLCSDEIYYAQQELVETMRRDAGYDLARRMQ